MSTRAATPVSPVTPVTVALSLGMAPLAVDELGVPRLLRPLRSAAAVPATTAATPVERARQHVQRLAPAWNVPVSAVPDLEARGDVPVAGGTVTRLGQSLDGLPVDESEIRVFTGPAGELVAASGILRSREAARPAPDYTFDDAGAVARAVSEEFRIAFPASALRATRGGRGARLLTGAANGVDVSLARATKAWFPRSRAAEAPLTAAWIVEVYATAAAGVPRAPSTGDAVRIVVGADGRVLARRSLVADAFAYRVFAESAAGSTPLAGPYANAAPHPTGTPDGRLPVVVAPILVTTDGFNHPAGQAGPDPWLATGATETQGNNVDAYADVNEPDGLSGGESRATTTGATTFDHAYDLTQEPLATPLQQMAAVTSLFYAINWTHDFWYDAGFTETAGNAQVSNLGRGGVEGDPVLGEAQDGALAGSRNNANMATPADGMPAKMQVNLWSAKSTATLAISNRSPLFSMAAFSPSSFAITGAVTVADDGVAPLSDACAALTNTVTNQIVLVDRGSCSFKRKALNVQTAGGAGMILVDNNVSATPPTLGDDNSITTQITIGVVGVTSAEGTQIRTDLASGAVSATLTRTQGPELDGAIDAGLIAHEFGHLLHLRLSVCTTAFCRAQGEGWADFGALLMMSRSGSDLMGAYPFATYSTLGISQDPGYYGIRRAPYSADPAINALSFRHMASGEPLPTNHPILPLFDNAEVHSAGEVWASALWDGYVGLQQASASFDATNLAMRKYVVAGLLLAPPDATPTETRDAVLTATHAASPADATTLATAFAGRGFGTCATSPDRNSGDFVGIIEGTAVTGRGVIGSVALALSSTCDADDVLDAGETGTVTVPVANLGDVALSNVTVTLAPTAAVAGLTLATPSVTIPSIAAHATTTATFEVSLAEGATGPLAGDLSVTVTSSGGCADTLQVPLGLRLDTDDVAASSTTDSFAVFPSVWTTAGSTTVWTQQRPSALDGRWVGVDRAGISDASLVSPPLMADATAPVSITLHHAYSFEFVDGAAYDGGVIEISTDGGVTWVDIATMLAASPYPAQLVQGNNPLAGRAAFGGTSPSYPSAVALTLDLGTQLAGQTFQLRFRIGTDEGASAPGWQLLDVAFSGIVGTPFPAQVADAGTCAQPPGPDAGPDAGGDTQATGDGGGCCQAGGLPRGNVLVMIGVALMLSRRRGRGGTQRLRVTS